MTVWKHASQKFEIDPICHLDHGLWLPFTEPEKLFEPVLSRSRVLLASLPSLYSSTLSDYVRRACPGTVDAQHKSRHLGLVLRPFIATDLGPNNDMGRSK